ncbi:sensor domain-containing protein, partial [Streptomyces sp. NPDC090133]|uniref:sensor domain-containing protein n=1 Tax=Streptomyces sp. NPDC090133 TaxID=3365956 RepID=UPI0037FBAD72
MGIEDDSASDPRRAGRRDTVVSALSAALAALQQLIGGFGTALLALLVLASLVVTALTCLVGLGLLLAPVTLRTLHAVVGRERDRLARHGLEIVAPDPPPTRLRQALTDPTTHRELCWLVQHVTLGLLLGCLGVLLPIFALRDLSFPLWWQLGPGYPTLTSVGV